MRNRAQADRAPAGGSRRTIISAALVVFRSVPVSPLDRIQSRIVADSHPSLGYGSDSGSGRRIIMAVLSRACLESRLIPIMRSPNPAPRRPIRRRVANFLLSACFLPADFAPLLAHTVHRRRNPVLALELLRPAFASFAVSFPSVLGFFSPGSLLLPACTARGAKLIACTTLRIRSFVRLRNHQPPFIAREATHRGFWLCM